ncbi:hypothetical protein GU926_04940 [Nibribacter ruber]|uniref:STAS/SEC14 domain-containing protein n=1 Tax=Nibribacter ruber TaxID=2698458 RepID=A0A6P1NY12_9BACT|nr:hypothetical protein [Nibribacter ruber]QHL86818.1 hypothetical protein GU926_04940 [Nibribacter ruber]
MDKPQRINLDQDSFIKLEYDATHDILFGYCPDFTDMNMKESNNAFKEVVKTLLQHGITKLMIDSRLSYLDVSSQQHKAVLELFALNLYSTKLKKFARIMTEDDQRENSVLQVIDEGNIPFAFKNFKDIPSAVEWLKSQSS